MSRINLDHSHRKFTFPTMQTIIKVGEMLKTLRAKGGQLKVAAYRYELLRVPMIRRLTKVRIAKGRKNITMVYAALRYTTV